MMPTKRDNSSAVPSGNGGNALRRGESSTVRLDTQKRRTPTTSEMKDESFMHPLKAPRSPGLCIPRNGAAMDT